MYSEYDMPPAFLTSDPLSTGDAIRYQRRNRSSPQFHPQDITFRQLKTIDSHVHLRSSSPPPLEVVHEEVVATIMVAPVPTNRRFACCHVVSDSIRTRRPNVRSILKGNNKYGRKGKRRCLQCRHWKQKVGEF
jgi:hypothetical protein